MSEYSQFGNPFLTEDTFNTNAGTGMTRMGVVRWLFLYLIILCTTGFFVWDKAMTAFKGFDFTSIHYRSTGQKDSDGKEIKERVAIDPVTGQTSSVPKFDLSEVTNYMLLGCFGGFIVGMIIIFNPQSAPFLGPIYAALEGLAIGGISARYEAEFDGIMMQAVAGTLLVLISMFGLFATGFIRVNGAFVGGVLACMLGLLGIYVVDIFLPLDIVHGNGPMAIGLSVFACVLAAFNFAIDFDTIEKGVKDGAPKYMNAYCAFGVLVTLVWLYLELLRLIAKLRSKSDD